MRKLVSRHDVRRAEPPPLPLLEPIDGDVVKIRGVAATADVDLDRTCFARDCWPEQLDPSKIRLLVSHDENRVAGTVDEIRADIFGRVTIVATITSKAAMRLPGLSISARVKKFSIRDPDDRFAFRGEVERVSDVNEISLSSTPSNRHCLVLERWVPSPVEISGQALLAQIRRVQTLALAIKEKGLLAA
jgi:hypothetical protein